LFEHVVSELDLVALNFLEVSLAASALFRWAILIADVSLDHLLLELAPLAEFLSATFRVGIFFMIDWAHEIVPTFVQI
jgi:hypothetical protein